MTKTSKLLILFVFSLLFFASTSSVLAQDVVWSTPEKIDTSSNQALLPTIVTGPNGYLHSAWMELTPGDDFWTGTQTPGIFYSYWNGDTWSAPYKISDNTGWTGFPAIAVTTNNNVHILWEDDSANPSEAWGRILYRYYNGSSWSSPISIAPSLDLSGSWAWNPQAVRDAADNLHVVFNYAPPGQAVAEVYYTKWNGSSWSTPVRLTVKVSEENIQHYSIAVDSSNNPHVILWELGGGSWDPTRGIHHTYFNGTSWQTPVQLSTGGASYPKIVIDNNNYRHVIWVTEWFDMTNNVLKNKVEYIKWTGSSWSSPTTITLNAVHSNWLLPITGLTFDSSNNVYVGWGERVGWGGDPTKGIRVSYKKWSPATGTWSDPVFMRSAYDLDTPFLYKDKWDNQHLTWSEENETSHVWEFWYSAVPVNIQTYNPASAFSMTLSVSNDTLSIPAGALATTTNISAQIGPLPASANPAYTTLPRSFTYRPHGTTFAAGKEATAVIKYTDAEMMGTDEKNMKLYIWDGQTSSWSPSFTTSINTSKNQATVTLPHFSLFGIFLKKVKTTWLDPLTQEKPFQLGSTIPLRFKLAYADDSALDPGEDVALLITDSSGAIVSQFTMGKKAENLRYNPETGQFLATFKTKGLAEGNYEIKVILVGNPVGEKTLPLTPPKGKTP